MGIQIAEVAGKRVSADQRAASSPRCTGLKYSSGEPAPGVAASPRHRSTLPLRGVEATR